MQRVAGKTSAVRALLVCVLAASSAWLMAGPAVPETLASSELRAPATAAKTGALAAPASSDDDVQVRHVVAPGEMFSTILAAQGLSAVEAPL